MALSTTTHRMQLHSYMCRSAGGFWPIFFGPKNSSPGLSVSVLVIHYLVYLVKHLKYCTTWWHPAASLAHFPPRSKQQHCKKFQLRIVVLSVSKCRALWCCKGKGVASLDLKAVVIFAICGMFVTTMPIRGHWWAEGGRVVHCHVIAWHYNRTVWQNFLLPQGSLFVDLLVLKCWYHKETDHSAKDGHYGLFVGPP